MSKFQRTIQKKRNKRCRLLRKVRRARDEASRYNRTTVPWTMKRVLSENPYMFLVKKSEYEMSMSIYNSMRVNPRFTKPKREVVAKK